MAPQFCLPEPHLYEFAKVSKFILWPVGHTLHRPFEHPLPDSWKKVPKEKEVEIDEERESIFLPAASKGRQPKYVLNKNSPRIEELGYKLYEHFASVFDPVVVRKIPFNGCVLTISCTKVKNRMQITASLLSGKVVFCKEYAPDEKVRVYNLRFDIKREMIVHHDGSSNTTFHLVLEGQTSRLRGNALIGVTVSCTAPESKHKKRAIKKIGSKKKQ